jgi:hypothetical protein
VWSYWSTLGCLPRWRIGEHSPDLGGTGEIKYPGQTKTRTAALRFAERSVRARGRKPRRQITWSSRLGVVRRASYPSTEKENKIKNLNIQNPDGLKGLTVRSKGRPKQRWEDNIMQDIRQLNIKNWTACVQDRVKRKNFVEKAKTFYKGS